MGSFPYLEIEVDTKTVTKVASSDAIAISTNRSVNVEVNAQGSWLTAVVEGEQLVLSWKDNNLETSREATVTLSTPNSLVTKSLLVIQDASGELTVHGDLILHNREEIASNTYTKATGDLIVGNVTSIVSKAVSSSVSVEFDGRMLTASPTDINDVDLAMLKDQIHLIEGEGMAVVNTKATTIPVDIITANGVQEVCFDYNNMKELPSAEVLESMNLKQLSIRGNAVADISALAGCGTIRSLDISGNEVYDLEPIKDMAGLQKVVMDNLPISLPKLEVFREQCDNIEVIANEVRPEDSPLPVFGAVETTVLSENQVMITVCIDANATDITNAGFYIGNKRDLDNMSWYAASYSDGVLSLLYDVETLENVIYYVRAYAENATGGDYSKAGYFGSLTSEEDIYLRSYADLDKFYEDTYSHVNGSVFVGNMTTSGTSGIKLDDGKYSMYFKSTDMSDLSKLNQLVYVRDGLYIGNVGLSKMEYVSHISGMQTLWLSGNRITNIPELECNETLKYLDVSMNELEDIAFVENMPALETLYLGSYDMVQNETNDIGLIDVLANNKNLKFIDLSGLPLHAWQVDDLRTAMPETEIVFVSAGRDPHIPTVRAGRVNRNGSAITLNGTVMSKGKSDIVEHGFYFGKEGGTLEKVVVGEGVVTGETFSYTIDVQDLDIYKWYPYATNIQGESRNSLSSFTLAYEDLSDNGTANCYLIQQPGKYKFNASVRGNSLTSVGVPVTAEVIWEFRNPYDSESVISEVTLNSDGYVEFNTDEDVRYGNALIAVKDADGKILWSWHIWMCDFDQDITAQKYRSGVLMMDRNLGATLTRGTDHDEMLRAAGMMYQWGKKDPLSLNTVEYLRGSYSNIEESFAEPTHFVTAWTWFDNGTGVQGLWSAETKTMYDPCPPGWMVADVDSWDGLVIQGHNGYGVTFTYDDDGNTAEYPYTPFYSIDFSYGESESGIVWSSELPEGEFWMPNRFSYWSGSSDISMSYNAEAFSVRCMEDVGFIVSTKGVNTDTHATEVYGNVVYDGSTTVSERGFVFSSDTSIPTLNNSTVITCGAGDGDFSATLTGLTPNTDYWVRAYATGKDVTRYGSVVHFKTNISGTGDNDFTEDDYDWE